MNLIQTESLIWQAAQCRDVTTNVIHNQTVLQLDQLLADTIRHVKERFPELSKLLWDLRLSVLQTLLPFGDPRLGLMEKLKEIGTHEGSGSFISELFAVLGELIESDVNPKKGVLDDVFCGMGRGRMCLWARPFDSAARGWPDDMEEILRADYQDQLLVIQRIRELPLIGEKLVLVSPLHAKLFIDAKGRKLVRAGRWRNVDVLRYACPLEDDAFTRSLFLQPRETAFWQPVSSLSEISHGDVPISFSTPSIDEHDPFPLPLLLGWREGDPASGEPVPAIRVVLSSNEQIAFSVERQIRLLNSQKSTIAAIDLEEGDLIPVRIREGEGSALDETTARRLGGQQIIDVMAKERRAWKGVVGTCLRHVGSEKFRRAFWDEAGTEKEPWEKDAWSGDEPWAPRSRRGFESLIRAARSLDFFLDVESIEQFTQEQWGLVQQLRVARRAQGRHLFQQLDDELDERIARTEDWQEGQEVRLANSGRKYLICAVRSVADAGLLFPNQLEKLAKWQH